MKGNGLLSILINLALLVVVLLLLWGAERADQVAWVIPSSETTAEQLVGALAAHRYEGAMEQLSQDLQNRIITDQLMNLVKAIEEGPHQGIQDAHGEQSQAGEKTASVLVDVKLGDNSEQMIELPLQKENGLWKVTSIEPLYLLVE